jgi:hypothetical protein
VPRNRAHVPGKFRPQSNLRLCELPNGHTHARSLEIVDLLLPEMTAERERADHEHDSFIHARPGPTVEPTQRRVECARQISRFL